MPFRYAAYGHTGVIHRVRTVRGFNAYTRCGLATVNMNHFNHAHGIFCPRCES